MTLNMHKLCILICSVLLMGCAEKQSLIKFDVACPKHAVIHSSFRAELLEIDEQSKMAYFLRTISPENDVIFQAIYNCNNGVFLLYTQERMKSGIDTILRAVFKNGEKKLDFKNGINSIIPYTADEYLVSEQIIRGKSADAVRSSGLPHVLGSVDTDSLLQKSTYIDDVVLDVKRFEVVKKIPGTLDPHEYQDKRYITYTNDKVALDFNPENGDRRVIVDYRKNTTEGRNTVDVDQFGAQRFYLSNRLYLVNGETPASLLQSGVKYLTKNTVFYFDEGSKKWINIFDLDDNPLLVIHNDSMLIILCRQTAFEFDHRSHVLRKFQIPMQGYHWLSIGELQDSYLIAGANKANQISLFLTSKDFMGFQLLKSDVDFSNIRISTMLTPISPKQILQ